MLMTEQILNFFVKNQKIVLFGSKCTYLLDMTQGRRTALPAAYRPNLGEFSDCKPVTSCRQNRDWAEYWNSW